ncbi:IclR family transcriptional regulator [Evansella halocellulosilytica]|uniref:IclR family transcriptional regulator n=1 Tax=Evansella halocellulosilytica TaxID=2011013 RepID=UPI000BB9717F|nr:IclR family transcriptional regulator [Evansella halocellulosilytica]
MSKTIAKALQILKVFTEEKPFWRLDEMSKHLSIPKPTTYRLLKSLESEGFVQKVSFYQQGYLIEGEVYQLGTRLLELGQTAAGQYEVRNIALPYMRELQKKLGQSVQLAIPDQNASIYIEKVEDDRPVRLYTKIGRRAPLYAGACPRALLSFFPDELIHDILKDPIEPIGPQTLKTKEEVWQSIREAREKGYTFSDSELAEGTAAYGTPIYNRFGEVEASLSVAGFSSVLKNKEDHFYVMPMWEVSAKISKRLGFQQNYNHFKNE